MHRHSVLRFFAGLVNAAFAEWNMAVAAAVTTITSAERINGNIDKPVLYGNIFNQLLIKYHATGKAMKADSKASQR